jgi:hypothetical protein
VESIRALARCINLTNPDNFSVVRDFFGYQTGAPTDLSLLQQVRRVKRRHIHLNLIRVGSESFTNAEEREIDAAVQATREFYDQVNLGIGRVEHFFITTADANGRDNIDNDAEAVALTDAFTVPNDAFDVFFVLTYAGATIGLSAVDGPCNKNAAGMDGSVVAIEGDTNTTGFVLGHEVGHYLGLDHVTDDSTNLMFGTVPNGGNLTSSQGDNMRDHCFVDPSC